MKWSYIEQQVKNVWEFIIHVILPLSQIVSAIVIIILTYQLAQSNKVTADVADNSMRMAESATETAKLFKTKELCIEFNVKYWMYDYNNRFNHPKDLDFIHLWTYPEWEWGIDNFIVQSWTKMDKSEKLKQLNTNIELYALLEYFENAKELDKMGYLYRPYFYNFFVNSVQSLLEKDDNLKFKDNEPTFTEYIDMKRKIDTDNPNPYIWDGFDYCLTNIFITGTPQEKDSTWFRVFQNAWNKKFSKFEQKRGSDSVQLDSAYKYYPHDKDSYTNTMITDTKNRNKNE
jgi:hypothetical protein